MIDNMNKAHSLKEVNEQFEAFRATRKRMTKFPDQLWHQAVNLLKYYSVSEVARTLRISNHQIKTQINKFNAINTKEEVQFIALNDNAIPRDDPIAVDFKCDDYFKAKVEITRPDGAQLVISQLSESTLSKLLDHFVGGL